MAPGSSAGPTPGRVQIKAAGETKPQAIAGAVAHAFRGGDSPCVTAIGASSMNQALKAVIIARSYLKDDGYDLDFVPKPRPDIGFDGVELVLSKLTEAAPSSEEATVLKVASGSTPGAIAGAIAGKAREGSSVALVGLGADAVKKILLAITMASKFLEGDSISLRALPTFIHVDIAGEQRSAVKVHVVHHTTA